MAYHFKIPRHYQESGIVATIDYLDNQTGDGLLGYPTGTGKSLIIAEVCRRVCEKYSAVRILMVTHDKKLVRDNFEELLNQWPTAPAGINSAGLKKRHIRQITFAGIGSIITQAHLLGHVNLVIVDEAHRISPREKTSYVKLFNVLRARNPNLRVVGLTATMYRTGQGMLNEGEDRLFADIIEDWTSTDKFNQLLAEGFITRLVPKKNNIELDVSGVGTQNGEFKLAELQLAVDREEITYGACLEAREAASDRKHWLVFCSGIEHAVHVTETLNRLGVTAVCSHSKMTEQDQNEAERAFKAGEFQALVNNSQFTTGFNYPEIDCIVVLRPTKSTSLWVQILGRGTRPVWPTRPGASGCNWRQWERAYADKFNLDNVEDRLACIELGPKPDCLVLDFAMNRRRLGPINAPLVPRAKGKGKGEAPFKICPECETANHAAARVCAQCGEEFKLTVKFGQVAAGDSLIIGDAPQVDVFPVKMVVYSKHTPRDDRPPSLLVTYTCGLRSFTEWVCIEHEGFAGKKARDWWRDRDQVFEQYGLPTTVDEARSRHADLRRPTHLRIWVNKKYPEIMAADFSGTAFGKQLAVPDQFPEGLAVDRVGAPIGLEDDDIPF